MCVSEKICSRLYSDKDERYAYIIREDQWLKEYFAKIRCAGLMDFGKGRDRLTRMDKLAVGWIEEDRSTVENNSANLTCTD